MAKVILSDESDPDEISDDESILSIEQPVKKSTKKSGKQAAKKTAKNPSGKGASRLRDRVKLPGQVESRRQKRQQLDDFVAFGSVKSGRALDTQADAAPGYNLAQFNNRHYLQPNAFIAPPTSHDAYALERAKSVTRLRSFATWQLKKTPGGGINIAWTVAADLTSGVGPAKSPTASASTKDLEFLQPAEGSNSRVPWDQFQDEKLLCAAETGPVDDSYEKYPIIKAATTFKRLLECAPSPPHQLPLAVVQRLRNEAIMHAPVMDAGLYTLNTIKMRGYSKTIAYIEGRGPGLLFRLSGFTPSGQEYAAEFTLALSRIDSTASIPQHLTTKFVTTKGQKVSPKWWTAAAYADSPQSYRHAMRLGKMIYIRFNGFIGTEDELRTSIWLALSDYITTRARVKGSRLDSMCGPYGGWPLWEIYVADDFNARHPNSTTIEASQKLKQALPDAPDIIIQTQKNTRIVHCLSSALQVFMSGTGVLLHRKYLAELADAENVLISQGETIEGIDAYQGHLERRLKIVDVCVACLRLDLGRLFVWNLEFEISFCHFCHNLVDKNSPKDIGDVLKQDTCGLAHRLFKLLTADDHCLRSVRSARSRLQRTRDVKTIIGDLAGSVALRNDAGIVTHWHDAWVADVCPDISKEEQQQWGTFQDYNVASIEATMPIALGSNGETMHHARQNYVVTALYLNLFHHEFPPSAFKIAQISRNATSMAELREAATRATNLAITVSEIKSTALGKYHQHLSPARIAELQEAMRTCQPLLSRTSVSKLSIAHKRFMKNRQSDAAWRSQHHDWVYEQLHQIHQLPEFRHLPVSTWLTPKGVFYPYSANAPTDRWTNEDLWQDFRSRYQMMKSKCNRKWATITIASPELIILEVMGLWLEMQKPLLDKSGEVIKDTAGNVIYVARDPSGLELWPQKRTMNVASFGHDVHGEAMQLSYVDYYPTNQALQRDTSRRNVVWITWCTNKMNAKVRNDLQQHQADQLNNLREDSLMTAYWDFSEPVKTDADCQIVKYVPSKTDASADPLVDEAEGEEDDELDFLTSVGIEELVNIMGIADSGDMAAPESITAKASTTKGQGATEPKSQASGAKISTSKPATKISTKLPSKTSTKKGPVTMTSWLKQGAAKVPEVPSPAEELQSAEQVGTEDMDVVVEESLSDAPVDEQEVTTTSIPLLASPSTAIVISESGTSESASQQQHNLATENASFTDEFGQLGDDQNLPNVLNSCFISSQIQVFNHVEALRDAIMATPDKPRLVTGRPTISWPKLAQCGALVEALQLLLSFMSVGAAIPAMQERVRLFFEALALYNSDFTCGQPDDTSDFVTTVFGALNDAGDMSEARLTNDAPERNYQAEQDLAIQHGYPIESLQNEIKQQYQAHLALGNQSLFGDLMTLQIATESQCPDESCISAFARGWSFPTTLDLDMPADASGSSVMLMDLLNNYFHYVGPESKCEYDSTHPPRVERFRKIVRLPRVLTIRINRAAEQSSQGFRTDPVDAPDFLDLTAFTGHPLPSEIVRSENAVPKCVAKYHLRGIVRYIPVGKHYRSYVLRAGTHQHWLEFDDLHAGRAKKISPGQSQRRKNECEVFLYYVQADGLNEAAEPQALSTGQAPVEPVTTVIDNAKPQEELTANPTTPPQPDETGYDGDNNSTPAAPKKSGLPFGSAVEKGSSPSSSSDAHSSAKASAAEDLQKCRDHCAQLEGDLSQAKIKIAELKARCAKAESKANKVQNPQKDLAAREERLGLNALRQQTLVDKMVTIFDQFSSIFSNHTGRWREIISNTADAAELLKNLDQTQEVLADSLESLAEKYDDIDRKLPPQSSEVGRLAIREAAIEDLPQLMACLNSRFSDVVSELQVRKQHASAQDDMATLEDDPSKRTSVTRKRPLKSSSEEESSVSTGAAPTQAARDDVRDAGNRKKHVDVFHTPLRGEASPTLRKSTDKMEKKKQKLDAAGGPPKFGPLPSMPAAPSKLTPKTLLKKGPYFTTGLMLYQHPKAPAAVLPTSVIPIGVSNVVSEEPESPQVAVAPTASTDSPAPPGTQTQLQLHSSDFEEDDLLEF